MPTKTYDDFQEFGDGFDFISAKEFESRLDQIKENNEAEGGIYSVEIELMESVIASFESNGDSVKDLTRYSEFTRAWATDYLQEFHGWNSDDLPEAVRNAIDWNDVTKNLIDIHFAEIEVDGTIYYYEDEK